MFRKILFATDLSEMCEAPFQVALETAKKSDCKLYILHVLESRYSGKYRQFVKDIWAGEEIGVTGEYVEKVKELVKGIYTPKMNGFTNYIIEVRPGFPYIEILRTVRRENIELIVMAPHTGVAEIKGVTRTYGRIGSTLEGVTASARCPVMVIARPPERIEPFKKILIPTDFSKGSDYAFDFALEMAKKFDARLYIFNVPELIFAPGTSCPPQPQIERYVESGKERVKEKYGSKLKGFENYIIDAWEGISYVEILKFARTQDIDLIVMGPHTKEEVPTWYLGNTVEQVSMRSQCPMIVASRQEALRPIKELEE